MGRSTRAIAPPVTSLVAAVAAAAFLIACRPPRSTPSPVEAPSPEPTLGVSCVEAIHGDLQALSPQAQVVTFWHPYAGPLEVLILEMVDEFNRSNESGIRVLAESHDDEVALHDAIASGAAAGRVPDVSTTTRGQLAEYATSNLLAPLACYAADTTWGYESSALDGFFPYALDGGFIPQLGARYGWPFHATAEVLYYNGTWLTELGFESPPETWEQFAEMACAASRQPYSDSRGEGTVSGYGYTTDAHHFAAFVLSHGGSLISEDHSTYTFAEEAGLATLSFLQDLVQRGCAAGGAAGSAERLRFASGRTLFVVDPVHRLSLYRRDVEEGAGFDWSVALPPHPAENDSMRYHVYGPSLAVFRSTPERQLAAWMFVRWLNSPAQQALWAAGTSYLPTRQEAVDQLQDYRADNPQYDVALGLVGDGYVREPAAARHAECRVAIEQMLTAVMSGGDPRAALDAASARCADALQQSQ